MKKFWIHILSATAITIAAMIGINFSLETNLRKQQEDVYGKLNTVFYGKENYDVLFIGSSRTLVHINPRIIDSVLKIHAYNAGFDGATIVEYKMFLESYLENHAAPKTIVFNADTSTFAIDDKMKLYDFPVYFPYIKNKAVADVLNEYVPEIKWLSAFPFLKPCYYNDFKKHLALKSFLHPTGNGKNIFADGFIPQHSSWHEKILPASLKIIYTEKGINLLKEALVICKKNKVKAVVVYPPQTKNLSERILNFSEYKNLLQQICNDAGASFFDYSKNPLTENKKYFYNHLHLNSEGADVYSVMVAEDLK